LSAQGTENKTGGGEIKMKIMIKSRTNYTRAGNGSETPWQRSTLKSQLSTYKLNIASHSKF